MTDGMQPNKGNRVKNTLGIILITVLSPANLINLPWTFMLAVEQLQTGFGAGTLLEVGVLYPWMCEFVCFPVLLCGLLYFMIFPTKRATKGVFIANIVLLSLLVFQYIITNFCIFF